MSVRNVAKTNVSHHYPTHLTTNPSQIVFLISPERTIRTIYYQAFNGKKNMFLNLCFSL